MTAMDSIHLALFPFPEQGHINPMLQLALHLASRGAYVTFITTDSGHQRPYSGLNHLSHPDFNLQFASISDGFASCDHAPLSLDIEVSDSSGRGDVTSSALPALLRNLETQIPALEKLLTDADHAQNWPPLSWFISDAFMPWTVSIARKLQLSWVVFWTTSATRLYMNVQALDYKDVEQLKHVRDIPGLPTTSSVNVFDLLSLQNPAGLQVLAARVDAIKEADAILLNTYDTLEEEAIKELAPKLPIRSLGPLCLGAGAEPKALKADDECISWLDRQAPLSVLYVSFGTKVVLKGKSLKQLALGIESSKRPFLWALRSGVEELPEGFVERTKARSKIVEWVSQKEVLKHRAVGAFLTHCGWNSVIEAVAEGVPMICWPTCADQPTNKLLIEHKWRIGKGIPGQEVNSENIGQVIEEVMGNISFRQQASALSLSAISALQQGGTSSQNFGFLLSGGMHTNTRKPGLYN